MQRNKLPIGIQTFSQIREEGYYYVDKSAYVLRLAEAGKYFFLSRPRRFGKSLLLDTLAELFEGNQALFRGLFVHDRWDWSRHFPVLRINFGSGLGQGAAGLEQKCWEQLRINQAAQGITCSEPTIGCHASISAICPPKHCCFRPAI